MVRLKEPRLDTTLSRLSELPYNVQVIAPQPPLACLIEEWKEHSCLQQGLPLRHRTNRHPV